MFELAAEVCCSSMIFLQSMLTHWTKKIIVEEGHSVPQLVHIVSLICRHPKVYYPVRHQLIHHIVPTIQRLGLTPNASVEHRRLAVDIADVIIKWELQRLRHEQEANQPEEASGASGDAPSAAGVTDPKRIKSPSTSSGATAASGGSSSAKGADVTKPIEKQYCDQVMVYLLRMACHNSDTTVSSGGTSSEVLSRRCVALLKTALKSEVWPNTELKLASFEKILGSVETQAPNYGNVGTALELLCFLLTILVSTDTTCEF